MLRLFCTYPSLHPKAVFENWSMCHTKVTQLSQNLKSTSKCHAYICMSLLWTWIQAPRKTGLITVLGVVNSVETLHIESRVVTSVRAETVSDTTYQVDRSLEIQICIFKKHQILYNLKKLYFPIVHTIHFMLRVQFNLVCPALKTNKQKRVSEKWRVEML